MPQVELLVNLHSVVVRCTVVIVCGHLNYLVMYCVRCFMLYTDKPVWQMDVLQSYIPSWLQFRFKESICQSYFHSFWWNTNRGRSRL